MQSNLKRMGRRSNQIQCIAYRLEEGKKWEWYGSGSHSEWELDGNSSYFTSSGMGQDFFFFFFYSGWDKFFSVGMGWDRSENPVLSHPLA